MSWNESILLSNQINPTIVKMPFRKMTLKRKTEMEKISKRKNRALIAKFELVSFFFLKIEHRNF